MKDITFIVKLTNSCNLQCPYCYHFSNLDCIPKDTADIPEMSLDLIDKTIQTLLNHNKRVATFIWHGGEPLLRSKKVFESIVDYQKKYKKKKVQITNCVQTNGTLLNGEIIEFFKEHNFQVGVSLDGFEELYIKNRQCTVSQYNEILSNIRLMRQEGLSFGILCVITKETVKYPQKLFDFFVEEGIKSVAFLPAIVEKNREIDFAASVSAHDYSTFLSQFFEIWANSDTDMKVREYDEYLRGKLKAPQKLCVNSKDCSNYFTIASNGNIFLCDSFPMSEEWCLGTIGDEFKKIFQSGKYKWFIKQIKKTPILCRQCKNTKICNGGCKYRRWLVDETFSKPQHLCGAYKVAYEFMDRYTDKLI